MAFVVTDKCSGCKYGDCVEVCPVSCFYEGADQLVINPTECIDCEACVAECPVKAIVSDTEADEKSLTVAEGFEYTEETRRTSKDDVEHGPNYDENIYNS